MKFSRNSRFKEGPAQSVGRFLKCGVAARILQTKCRKIKPCFLRLASCEARRRNRYRGNTISRVEMRGFEPLTPCLQGRCSPN